MTTSSCVVIDNFTTLIYILGEEQQLCSLNLYYSEIIFPEHFACANES